MKGKGQKCNICDVEIGILDTHHIKSKTYDGTNANHNLVHVCPNCHRNIHLGTIVVEGWFMTTGGMVLIWHNNDEAKIVNKKEQKVYIIPRS